MASAEPRKRWWSTFFALLAPALALTVVAWVASSGAAERPRGFGGFGAGRFGGYAPGGGYPAFRGNFAARSYSGQSLAGRPAEASGRGLGPSAASRFPSGVARFGGPRFGGTGLFARNGLPRRPFPGEAGFTGLPPAGETRFVPGEVVVYVGEDVTREKLDATASRLGLSLVGAQTLSTGTLAQYRVASSEQVEDAIRNLEAEKVGIAQPNYIYTLQQGMRAPPTAARLDPSQYVVSKLQLDEVHHLATGENVLVAVIDSEVDATHPDLSGSIAGRFDAVTASDAPDEHGTGMTGAIVAHRKLVGVAPRARVLAIHAFSPNAQSQAATSQSILAGIDWAIKQGARVINMSFAGPYDPVLQVALKKAHDKGVVLVAAAGNMGPKSPPLYPAADENVIAVTAVDSSDRLLPEANRGPHIALAAPGVDVIETTPRAGYGLTTGTSVAAAHVSGVVALLIERDPLIDVATVENILFTTAKDLGTPGRDEQFGYGLIDPYRALNSLDPQVAQGKDTVANRFAALTPNRTPAAPFGALAAPRNSGGLAPGPAAAAGQRPAFTPSASERTAAVGSPPATSSGSAPSAQVAAAVPLSTTHPAATDRPTGTTMRLTQAAPNSASSPAPATVTAAATLGTTPEEVAESLMAVQKRRQSCRQQGVDRGMRSNADLADYVTICVAEVRIGCLKQAVADKVRGPARRDYLNKCMLGP